MNNQVICDRGSIMYQTTISKCGVCGTYNSTSRKHTCNKPIVDYITVGELSDTLKDLYSSFGDFPISSISLDSKGYLAFFTIIDNIPTVMFRVKCQEVISDER